MLFRSSSTLGQGSLFEMLLPVVPVPPPEMPAVPEPVTAPASRADADPAT